MRCKVDGQEEYNGADGRVGIEERANKLAGANDVRWNGHVLRQSEEDVLMKAMIYEVDEKCKQGRTKMKWRKC